MVFNNKHKLQVEQCKQQCFPEFSHVNHYWDNDRNIIVAKILPGEFYITKDNVVIATTLGSCVSACIWDTHAKIGGMNHFMLPITEKEAHEVDWGQRGFASDATRYGNFAMEHLINIILKNGGSRAHLQAKVFGGGKVLKKMTDVGERNIEFVLSYLAKENISIVSSDLGAFHPRKVLFEPLTGKVLIKHIDNLHNDTLMQREHDYINKIEQAPVEGDVEIF
jgi:chemotaxis protein CheD